MTWATRFRIREYLRESLWVVPSLGAVLGLLGAMVVVTIDSHVKVPPQWAYSPSTASTVLSAVAGAVAALTGFVVTVTVLVVQMATGTFSARYMRLWYRDPVLKGVLALLIGTLAFSFSLLRHIEARSVPDLGVTVAEVLLIVGLVMFVLFLNRFVHRLRPVAVVALMAKGLRQSLGDDIAGVRDVMDVFAGPLEKMDEPPALQVRCARPGAIQAVRIKGVAAWARQHDCLVVMRHSVGEFLETGDLLFEVYGDPGETAAAERVLRGLVAMGLERTIEQDAAFALRVMVDVANKALSPAVNDPTTAVQVLDYLGDSLRPTCRCPAGMPARSNEASSCRFAVGTTSSRWASPRSVSSAAPRSRSCAGCMPSSGSCCRKCAQRTAPRLRPRSRDSMRRWPRDSRVRSIATGPAWPTVRVWEARTVLGS